MNRTLLITILVLIALVIGWHFFFPFVGGVIAFSIGAWGALMASVVALSIAIMLIFIFTGTGVFILTIGAFIWTMLAIVLFPIVFPILVPLFIIFIFVSYFARRNKRKNAIY